MNANERLKLAVDAVTDPNPDAILLPRCPYCGESPARIASTPPFELRPGVSATIAFCGNRNCRAIHTVQVLRIEQPRILAPR